ncbi:MAG: ChaN family lipoprotein, partial [Alphaproteobacteria bacterium]|nr:ChaN family lipoprotein [Alphaproteobacteria bacterium]
MPSYPPLECDSRSEWKAPFRPIALPPGGRIRALGSRAERRAASMAVPSCNERRSSQLGYNAPRPRHEVPRAIFGRGVKSRPMRALLILLGALLAACTVEPETWLSAHHRDHPLVGRIWDPAAAAFVPAEAVLARAARAPMLLLGEAHDNPDHHRLQARILSHVAASGRRPAVGFEMIGSDQAERLARQLAEAPGDTDALGRALDWDKSGWPAFMEYRPIFQAALGARLPIVALSPPRDMARRLAREGMGAL